MLSSEVVREKHGRVSSRGDSLKLSVLLFRGSTEGWELSRRAKNTQAPWRRAETVSSVSQRTSPEKVVKWNPPISSRTMFPFEYFFLHRKFFPRAQKVFPSLRRYFFVGGFSLRLTENFSARYLTEIKWQILRILLIIRCMYRLEIFFFITLGIEAIAFRNCMIFKELY